MMKKICRMSILFGVFLLGACTTSSIKGTGHQFEPLTQHVRQHTVVKVFYATDRKGTPSNDPYDAYTTDRGELSYGVCNVSIPDRHNIGDLETPSIWRFEFRENPDKHIVVLDISKKHAGDFYDSLSKALASSENNILIFIHGYNVTFNDAARRTAQISFDLKFKGAPVFYSWPSQGALSKYIVDETNNQWTQPHLNKFLNDVINKTTSNNIYIIAHSMGNRILTSALVDLAKDRPSDIKRIKQVILAAPDIDSDVFKTQIAPKIISAGPKINLYASDHDEALMASELFHGYPRVGNINKGVFVFNGIDTIDASNADTSFLGHGYYAENRTILSDVYNIVVNDQPANKRFGLVELNVTDGTYWRISK